MAHGKRLGDLLVEAGLVTRLQVDHALQAQQVFGGRLGTNLIEMGALDDETLASFLSRQLRVPRITIEEMETVPREILDLVPAKAAQRLGILPVARAGAEIVMAMLDPSNEKVIARLEKNLGCKIAPRVATEIEIHYFLEKYYGIQRDMRHIALMGQILEERGGPAAARADRDPMARHLDPHISTREAVATFFEKVRSLEQVPARTQVKDVTRFDLTPEIAFLFSRVDGISTLGTSSCRQRSRESLRFGRCCISPNWG